MANPSTLRDVTGTVSLDDAASTAAAVDAILARTYGAASFDRNLLHSTFAFIERLFAGSQPGYLRCDMPYHDLRHSLDAALVMARLVDGCRVDGCDGSLEPDLGLTAVLLALMHDTGFLRTAAEASRRGPEFAAVHETRGATFAEGYLRGTSLAKHAVLAPLIMATRMASPPAPVFDAHTGPAVTIGRMLGSADLLCQVADRRYLERCYHHLYPELVVGGGDRARNADGTDKLLFRDARDLLAHTPAFHEHVVGPRLARDFANVARHLATHFGGADPYAASMQDNLERCRRIVAGNRWDLLAGPPPTTTRELDPVYRLAPPASGER